MAIGVSNRFKNLEYRNGSYELTLEGEHPTPVINQLRDSIKELLILINEQNNRITELEKELNNETKWLQNKN